MGKVSGEEAEQLGAWWAGFNTNPSLLSSLSSQELKSIADKMFLAITDALDPVPGNTED
jgi:hypothetical protein